MCLLAKVKAIIIQTSASLESSVGRLLKDRNMFWLKGKPNTYQSVDLGFCLDYILERNGIAKSIVSRTVMSMEHPIDLCPL
jgi:hypothetical protein